MSQRCVGYEGEGKVRRPVFVDEGPATAAASSPIAMLDRMGVPGLSPSGGAGPIERRQINEAERDARRPEPTAIQKAWNGHGHLVATTAPQMPQEAAMPADAPAHHTPYGALADAAARADEAMSRKITADLAWLKAQEDVQLALLAVTLMEIVPVEAVQPPPETTAIDRGPDGAEPQERPGVHA